MMPCGCVLWDLWGVADKQTGGSDDSAAILIHITVSEACGIIGPGGVWFLEGARVQTGSRALSR